MSKQMKVLAVTPKTESLIGTISGAILGVIQTWSLGDATISLTMAALTGIAGYFGTQLAKYIHSKFKK